MLFFNVISIKKTYKGSYYRVKAHMLKIKEARIASCSKVTNENVIEMQKVLEEAKHRVKQSNPKQVLFTHINH